VGLQRDNSMMTFETNQVAGVNNIVSKLVELPFQKVAHKLSTLDAQPAGDAGQILVHVTGQLFVSGFPPSCHIIRDGYNFT
jgi:hypothetical protein